MACRIPGLQSVQGAVRQRHASWVQNVETVRFLSVAGEELRGSAQYDQSGIWSLVYQLVLAKGIKQLFLGRDNAERSKRSSTCDEIYDFISARALER